METTTSTARKTYLDYLRVFATLAVIMLHLAAQKWYNCDVNGAEWRVLNFYNSIVRWGVPVFLMISGALFLDREEIPVKKILSKYVLRLLTAYLVWSFVYYLFAADTIPQQFAALFQPGCTERWVSIINGDAHMWFIPMIAGVYLSMPIIRQIVKNETVMRYSLCLSVVFWFTIPQIAAMFSDFGSESVVPITNAINGVFQGMYMGFIQNYAFYFILGYAMSKVKLSKKARMLVYALGIAGFAFTIVADRLVSLKLQTATGNYYGESRLNVLLEAAAVFELFKNIPFPKQGLANKVMQKLSTWSFGIYLVHMLLIRRLSAHGITTFSFTPIAAVPCLTVVVFLGAAAISAVLHYVPVLKKYIV